MESARPSVISSIRLGLLPHHRFAGLQRHRDHPGHDGGPGDSRRRSTERRQIPVRGLPAPSPRVTLLADGLIMVMIYRTCFTADDQYRPPKAR